MEMYKDIMIIAIYLCLKKILKDNHGEKSMKAP